MDEPIRPFRVIMNVHEDDQLAHGYDTGDVVNWRDYEDLKRQNELLCAVVRAADRLHSDTLYKWAPEAKDHYMKRRALVQLPASAEAESADE